MKAFTLLIFSLLMIPIGNAQTTGDSGYLSERRNSPVAKLLEQQRSGKSESKKEQNLDSKTRSNVYQRYVDSFGRPIPESFGGDSFSTDE